jgi:hypothetical protein
VLVEDEQRFGDDVLAAVPHVSLPSLTGFSRTP